MAPDPDERSPQDEGGWFLAPFLVEQLLQNGAELRRVATAAVEASLPLATESGADDRISGMRIWDDNENDGGQGLNCSPAAGVAMC